MLKDLRSEDKKIQKLTNVLTKAFEIDFCFEHYPLGKKDVFGHYGGLSLFLIEAQETYEKIANDRYTAMELLDMIADPDNKPRFKTEDIKKEKERLDNTPIERRFPIEYFSREENTYFSFIPRLSEEVHCDFYLLSMLVHHTIEEYVKKYEDKLEDGRVPLDELYAKMSQKLQEKRVIIHDKPYVKPAAVIDEKNETLQNSAYNNGAY